MIIDTSALIAILWDEPDAAIYSRAIEQAPVRRLSAGNFLEAAIVRDASGQGGRLLDDLLNAAGVVIEPVTIEQARIGRQAYRDYGRGSGHPAQLNFGDCFAYALAVETGEPLLFKGLDFVHTDVRPALPRDNTE